MGWRPYCESMSFFTGDDFRLNDIIEYKIEEIDGTKVVFIDNLYKNPDRVVEYLDSCPILSHKPQDPVEGNGVDFYDGRQTITEAYDPMWFTIHKQVASYLGFSAHFDGNCAFNMTMLNSSPKGHWFPHIDPHSINCIVYLNKDNNYGPGTSFYESFRYEGGGEHVNPWCKSAVESHCILDRYNCGVFFPGYIYHSMRLVGDTFKDKRRYTEVHFLNY